MKIFGIILIIIGLVDIIYEKPPSKEEKQIEAKIDELQKSKSVNLLLINDRKVNVGIIVLGLIFVLLD